MNTSVARWSVAALFAAALFVVPAAGCGKPKSMCSTATCTGCCDADGECQTGVSTFACGAGGQLCSTCQLGATCQLGLCSNTNGTGGGGGTSTGGGGGTSTGGGGGTSTGGGGGSCDGCFFQGSCVPKASTGSSALCGQGGVQCAMCSSNQSCVNYVCVTGTTGGGGGTTGGGGGTTGGGGGTTGGGGGTTGGGGGSTGGGGGSTGGGGGSTGGGGGTAVLGDTCDAPVSFSGSTTLTGTLVGYAPDYVSNCDTVTGPDRFYSFTVTNAPQRIVANLSPTGFSGLVSLTDQGCAAGEVVCRVSGSGALDTWLEIPGTYVLVVKSADGASGSFSTSVQLTTPVATTLSLNGTQSFTGTKGSYKLFTVTLPAAASLLTVNMSGSSASSDDADLYIRQTGAPLPVTNLYDDSSANGGSNESVTISNPAAGTYYVLVFGYTDYSTVSLTATVQ